MKAKETSCWNIAQPSHSHRQSVYDPLLQPWRGEHAVSTMLESNFVVNGKPHGVTADQRRSALRLLAEMNALDQSPVVIRLLRDNDATVREEATKTTA